MENLKIVSAQKSASKVHPKKSVTFTSLDNANVGDYFNFEINGKSFDYKVMSVIATDEEWLIVTAEGKDTSHRKDTMDIRTLIGLPVVKVTSEERLKILYRAENLI